MSRELREKMTPASPAAAAAVGAAADRRYTGGRRNWEWVALVGGGPGGRVWCTVLTGTGSGRPAGYFGVAGVGLVHLLVTLPMHLFIPTSALRALTLFTPRFS